MDDRQARFIVAAYNAHKRELNLRRRSDTVISAAIMMFYTFCCAVFTLHPTAASAAAAPLPRVIFTVIFILVANMASYVLYKNYKRHSEMQKLVADMDQVFGFFDEGAYLPGRSLYPPQWRGSGKWREASVYTRCGAVVLFALLAIASVWARGFC